MPQLHPIKPSFSGGEFAPSLYSRVDIARYATGAKLLRNMFVHPHGGASNRPGTYYVNTAKYDDKKVRLIPFEFSTLQTHILEFGDYYIRFYVDGNAIVRTSADAWQYNHSYSVGDWVEERYSSPSASPSYSPSASVSASKSPSSSPSASYSPSKSPSASYSSSTSLSPSVSASISPSISPSASYSPSKSASSSPSVSPSKSPSVSPSVSPSAAAIPAGTLFYCLVAHTSGTTFLADRIAHPTYWKEQVIYEIVSPYAEADLPYLNYTQSADVLYITHPDYPPMELARLDIAEWTLSEYNFTGGPFMIQNIDEDLKLKANGTTGTVTLTATGFTFEEVNGDYNGHVGSLWQLSHYVPNQVVSVALASATTSSSIKCGGTWRVITHGTWTGKLTVQKSLDDSNWTDLHEFTSVDDFNANTYGTEDMSNNAEPFYVRLNMHAYTSGTCNADLSADAFNQIGIVKITAVTSGGATATGTVERTIAFANTDTIDFSEGSWSDYRGWPSTVEFHPQDRLCFANTYSEPQTIWTTQTSNYRDFSRSDPLVDSDGITANMPSRKINGIHNLIPLTELIILTSSSEATFKSSSGALSPTTAKFSMNGWEGAYNTKPVVIGNRAIYVQAIGTTIRDLGYELYSDSFVGSDLSILSNHLFAGYEIQELSYQQNPDRLVWAIRDDGKLLSMTYLREQEVVAWTWHDTGEFGLGEDAFESVATISSDGFNEVWVAVRRGTQRYIERFAHRLISADIEDHYFVDNGVSINQPIKIQNIEWK